MTGFLIDLHDLLPEVAAVAPCPDCLGGVGVHIESPDWEVVVLHETDCPGIGQQNTRTK